MAERSVVVVKQEGEEVQNRREHLEISGMDLTVLELQSHSSPSKHSRFGSCTDLVFGWWSARCTHAARRRQRLPQPPRLPDSKTLSG